MTIFLYGLILVVLLVLYYFVKKTDPKDLEYIQCVEAGPTAGTDAEDLRRRSYFDRPTIKRGLKGEVLGNNYIRMLVKGNCMSERKICNGDLILVERMSLKENKDIDFKTVIKHDNIIWLHIEDTGMDKIRIFENWEGDEMKTYYFCNGEKKSSSENHKISQIRGIVRYKI